MPLIFYSFNQSTNMISSYHCQALWRNQWRAMQTKQTLTSRNLWSTYKVSSVQSHSHVWLFATPWLQHARLPCVSPTPTACSNSCPSSQWCQPTISSSVAPFSSHLQSFSASGSFPMIQFFTSGSQSIGVLALASVLPMNAQDWFPLGWTCWIFCSPRDSQESSPTPQFKSINSSALSFLYKFSSHIHTWLLEKL